MIAFNGDVFSALTTFALGIPWLPIAIGGSALLNLLFGGGNKNKNQQQPGMDVAPGSPLYEWLTTGMTPGSGGGGGGGTSRSTTNTNQTETRNLLTMPVIAPEFQNLVNAARGTLEQRFRFPQGLPPGYEAQGIQNANRTFDMIGKGLQNKLAGMGVSGSPGGAYPTAVLETGRGQSISDFQNRLPELARQFQNEDINMSGALAQMLGLGQRQTGTVKTVGQQTSVGQSGGGGGGGGPRFDPQGPLTWFDLQRQGQQSQGGGFFEQLLPTLMYLLSSGAFSGGNSGGRPATSNQGFPT